MLRKDYISQITKTARFIKSASKELVYHYENEISIYDNIFRPGSEKYFALIREAKKFKGIYNKRS